MNIKIKKKIVLILIIVLSGLTFYYFFRKDSYEHEKTVAIIVENDLDIVYGVDSAIVTIVMYSNYSCSYCKKFLIDVLPIIKLKYIDCGKVKFIMKLVSFSKDLYLIDAYKTAVCLNRYGDFEQLNNLLLFEMQTIYTRQFIDLTDHYIQRNSYFAECMISGESDIYLNNNKKEFIKYLFTGTPSFIISNKKYSGYLKSVEISNIIESELGS